MGQSGSTDGSTWNANTLSYPYFSANDFHANCAIQDAVGKRPVIVVAASAVSYPQVSVTAGTVHLVGPRMGTGALATVVAAIRGALSMQSRMLNASIHERRAASNREHRRILDAIASGDFADASETRNLASDHPETVTKLQRRIDELAAQAQKPILLETEIKKMLDGLHMPPSLPTSIESLNAG